VAPLLRVWDELGEGAGWSTLQRQGDNLLPDIPGYFHQGELEKAALGDEWAHTVVCKRSSLASERLRSDARLALGMTLALMADTAVRIVGLLLHIHSQTSIARRIREDEVDNVYGRRQRESEA